MILAYFRTILLYGVLMISVRALGKRQIGQLEASEFVVAMLVADLAAIPMQDASLPLLSGVVPILAVMGLELLCSGLIMKSVLLRKWLCGKPVILIENGKILQDNLRRSRITLDELTGHLRQKDVLDLKTVQYAILETDGNLSVFPYPGEKPASAADAGIPVPGQSLPVTVIADGVLFRQDLKRTGKDEKWLEKQLKKRHSSCADTLLLTVDAEENITWIEKEHRR